MKHHTSSREIVKEIFENYLENNQLRKTNTRFSILDTIYKHEGHFDADQLFHMLKMSSVSVSKATIYNTLEVLETCGLIKKHLFTNSHAVYEPSYGFSQHDHLFCTDCKEIIEFCDPRIQPIQTTIGKLFNFQIEERSLTLYGTCQNPACTKRNRNDKNK